MATVDEGFGQVDLAAVVEIARDGGQDLVQHALALPLLKAAVARRIRWVSPGHVRPGRARSEHPKDPVQDVTRIAPRASSLRGRALALRPRNQLPNRFPLRIRQVHRRRYKHLLAAMERPSRKMEQSRSLTQGGYEMPSSSSTACPW